MSILDLKQYKILAILLLCPIFNYAKTDESQCDFESYKVWFDEFYETDKSIKFYEAIPKISRSHQALWQILNLENVAVENVRLSNGQAMHIAEHFCRNEINGNIFDIAGKHFPIEQADQQVHDAMCSKYCLLNDSLRSTAMTQSKCTCLELSTQTNDLTFRRYGDFCHANSGDILCETKPEWCGTWHCSIEDFHCTRREYNRRKIPMRGYGSECSGSTKRNALQLMLLAHLLLVFQLF